MHKNLADMQFFIRVTGSTFSMLIVDMCEWFCAEQGPHYAQKGVDGSRCLMCRILALRGCCLRRPENMMHHFAQDRILILRERVV